MKNVFFNFSTAAFENIARAYRIFSIFAAASFFFFSWPRSATVDSRTRKRFRLEITNRFGNDRDIRRQLCFVERVGGHWFSLS